MANTLRPVPRHRAQIAKAHLGLPAEPVRAGLSDKRTDYSPLRPMASQAGAEQALPRRPVSLSTMWAVGRFERMVDFVRAAHRLGFAAIELNHQVTPAMLAEFIDLYQGGEVRISSVHDPCPRPDGLTGAPQLSSPDGQQRRQAVDLARRTLDLAARLGATAVIVHAGRVDIDLTLERRLRALFPARHERPAPYRAALREMEAARAARRQPYYDAALRSLLAIQDHARALGLRVALENRYHYYEIPLADELARLLDSLDGAVVGYWHDTGHAQVQANVGYGRQEDWLARFGARLVGIHLHDVEGMQDHLAARGGDVDFAAVRRFVPDGALRVCEFAYFNEPDQVAAAVATLHQIGYF